MKKTVTKQPIRNTQLIKVKSPRNLDSRCLGGGAATQALKKGCKQVNLPLFFLGGATIMLPTIGM